MNKILTLEEAKNTSFYCLYDNNDYEYINEEGYRSLIRDGIDLLAGTNAISCHSFRNNDYYYNDVTEGMVYISNE